MLYELNLKLGGEAGQGLQALGLLLGRLYARAGCHVFANQDNESRIRGGHNSYQLRVASRPVYTMGEAIDLLVDLDGESRRIHAPELVPGGLVLVDSASGGPREVALPLTEIARAAGGREIHRNSVAAGAVAALTGQDRDTLFPLIDETFAADPAARAINSACARAGYRAALETGKSLPFALPSRPAGRPYLNGHEALSLGCLAAGCKFMAAYPMSPSTLIITYLSGQADAFGLVVEQAEDEVAAINMALGASYAGVRALTATSGGGFALMVEGLSLAGMLELPVVVVIAQRPGPATGLPTRTEQGDLLFAIGAGHGEFPRFVLAPATAAEAFAAAPRAFDLAERFQVPVIILTDQHLAESYLTPEPFDFSRVNVTDYRLKQAASPYHRYDPGPDGVSPLAVPGTVDAVVVDSDEHDARGHIIEDAATRNAMVAKRLARIPAMRAMVSPPLRQGPPEAEDVLLGWGSGWGALCEAGEKLAAAGRPVEVWGLQEVWPLNPEHFAPLSGRRVTVVESNATGQMARLLSGWAAVRVARGINRYDGRPLSAAYIIRHFEGGETA
ncbi:MAG: 2-oxoacid:acceptor oxidoreductase subunit alpha [Peptococcaceae bacterium]|nr:2-oxoacid:acceptor oxidoreductase subunit alpha [Peptococcaceae bacterium]